MQGSVVIAVLNGTDVDSGTSWEMGFAFGLHKPIIGYLDDIRIGEPERQLNPMILNSICCLAHSFEELTAELKAFKD